jgi:hypothetical protein
MNHLSCPAKGIMPSALCWHWQKAWQSIWCSLETSAGQSCLTFSQALSEQAHASLPHCGESAAPAHVLQAARACPLQVVLAPPVLLQLMVPQSAQRLGCCVLSSYACKTHAGDTHSCASVHYVLTDPSWQHVPVHHLAITAALID